MFRMECLNIHAAEYEIVLSIEGTEMSTFSLFRVKQVTRRGVGKVYLLLPWKSLFRGE